MMRKFMFLVLAALCLCGAVVQVANLHTLSAAASQPAINWGLKHKGMETAPDVPAGADALLKQYNGLYAAAGDEKKVYLTFDLGYESGYTDDVLDTLEEHSLTGIFFLCGHYLNERELVERMVEQGHYIGNHTDKHKHLPSLSEEAAAADIMTIQNDFAEQYPDAEPMAFFRPPRGSFDEKTLKIANANNLKTLLWTIAIVDWEKKPLNAETASDKIISRIHPGAVILLHIANSGTPKMLDLLIAKLAEKGYAVGHPDELLGKTVTDPDEEALKKSLNLEPVKVL